MAHHSGMEQFTRREKKQVQEKGKMIGIIVAHTTITGRAGRNHQVECLRTKTLKIRKQNNTFKNIIIIKIMMICSSRSCCKLEQNCCILRNGEKEEKKNEQRKTVSCRLQLC